MDNQNDNIVGQVIAQNLDWNASTGASIGKVVVIIRDPQWNDLWQFEANNETNIAAQAVANWIIIPVSCGGWVCWVCLCKVIQWWEVLKADAFNSPLIPLLNDENGNSAEVLSCIAWFRPEIFGDWQEHLVILQRMY